MKNFKLSFAIVCAIIIGISFVGCEKENELLETQKVVEKSAVEEISAEIDYNNLTVADMPQLEVRDGMLYFEDAEQYFKAISIVGNMTHEELDKWEQELGFVSLRTIVHNAYEELLNAETEDDVYEIIGRNSEYLEIIIDEKGEQHVESIIDNPNFSSIINHNCLYLSSENVVKITKNYKLFFPINFLNKIININENDIIDLKNDDKITIHKYTIDETKTGCGQSTTGYVMKDERWCRNDRRCYIKMATYTDVESNRQYVYRSYVYVWGKRKITSCAWIQYRTNLTLTSSSNYTVKFIENSSFDWGIEYFSYVTVNRNYSWGFTITENLSSFFSYNPPPQPNQPYFTHYYGKASSSGVGSKWITISCPN